MHQIRILLFKSAGVLNGVSAALIGLYQVKDALVAKAANLLPLIPKASVENWFDVGLSLSIVLIIVSLPPLLVGFILKFTRILNLSPYEDVQLMPCTQENLSSIFDLARSEFGGRASSMENINRLFNYCSDSFWVVTSKEKIKGYFIIYALSKAGENAILTGSFNGANPAPEHINKSIKTGKSICVGAVVGLGAKPRAAVRAGLVAYLHNLKQELIYAKPVTSDGLRFCKDFDMKCVDDGRPPKINKYCVINKKHVFTKPNE